MDNLDHKEFKDQLDLKVTQVHSVQKVIKGYKDLEARLVHLAHAVKSARWDLKVCVDHKALQVNKDVKVNQAAQGNVVALVHVVHAVRVDPVALVFVQL